MKSIEVRKKSQGRIIVTFPYNPEYVLKIKTIKGHRWHPKEKYWSFLEADGTLEKILKIFKTKKFL